MFGIALDRSLPRSLSGQLCDALRSGIRSGLLAGGARLPSSRELAEDLKVSRNVVLEAYEQLVAEGYALGRSGSGTYVAAGAALGNGSSYQRDGPSSGPGPAPPARIAPGLAARAGASARARAAGKEGSALLPIDFRTGLPALALFPREAWARALSESARRLPPRSWGYGAIEGLDELREAIAAYIYRGRGIRASPEEVLVTTGTSQALGILTRILGRDRESFVLENPCQPALRDLILREGIPLSFVSVDAQGLDPGRLPEGPCAALYATASHQFPLGSILSAPRRAAISAWARRSGATIVEDDYDGEFRYGGAPLLPLRESDPERVAYAGSFSKVFSPAIRLGYALLPDALRKSWRFYKALSDIHSPLPEQAAMARFISSGALELHLRRMRRAYAARRAALLESLGASFGDRVEVLGAAAGLHLAARFPGREIDAALARKIADRGAIVYPAASYAASPEGLPALRDIMLLGYGNLSEADIREGVRRIAAAM